MMIYRIGRIAGAVAALAVWLAPGPAAAAGPVAAVVMYEVAEALTLKVPKGPGNVAEAKRRLADATLLGKKIVPLTTDPTSPWAAAQFISAQAQSSILLSSGQGPIHGTFELLKDVDPTRESLDTLVVFRSGALHGVLDLSMAELGFAKVSGNWSLNTSSGTFAGVFLVPFPYGAGYAYVDLTQELHLDQLGLSLCDPSQSVPLPGGATGCLLRNDEFALGIPLTKAVLILSGN